LSGERLGSIGLQELVPLAMVSVAMTVSLDARRHNFNEALIRMTEDAGETPLYDLDFETKSDRFEDILATTWDELMECGYTRWRWQDTYNLTVEGWTEGMVLLERHKQPEFEAKLQRLMGTLKDQIKGRDDYEAYLPLEQASAESGVSQELIRNILEGRFIEKVLGRIGAKLDTDQVIVIPRRFGQRQLGR
jgi:hypothetical protein